MKFEESAYNERIASLFSRFQSVQQVGFTGEAYKPGLSGMEELDAHLGHPWKRFRCIHVAGTNGKGSVSSMLASSLAAEDLRVGLYTSPHLLDFRERIKLVQDDGFSLIGKEEVWQFLEDNEDALEGRSFFEITTGMAFWWFARVGVDIAVVEVGLGGRLDSTNIISPELSIITSIGLDHCALLGNSRAEIAAEKAGIFKSGVPALVASRDDETAPIFERMAAEKGCPLTFASDIPITDEEEALLPQMDLQGPCQKENLHTCIVSLLVLTGIPPETRATLGAVRGGTMQRSGMVGPSDSEAVEGGIPARTQRKAIARTAERTGLRGRWEKVLESPETICDIAHNPPALKLNFARLESICKERPTIIIYGIMADKDLAGIAPLMPSEADYIFTAPANRRALPAEDLLERVGKLRPELKIRAAGSVAEAVCTALKMAAEQENPFIYIGGSTFVVAEALEYLQKPQ